MSKVIFKELLIADIEKKTAQIIKFTDGKNLLTSPSNHLGKSLVCKSLYYTLGAETFFSDTWKRVNSLYWLTIDVDGKEYKIVRKNYIFTIYEPNGTIVKLFRVKNLTEYLNKLFNLDIKLVAKDDEKSIISSAPVFMYLPYYIDQEHGWTPDTESFDRLTQFSKPQRKISLFYHLGCYGKDYVEKNLKYKQLLDEQASEDQEYQDCKRIVDYLQDLLDENGDILANETELAEKIRQNKTKLDALLAQMEKLKSEIIKLENEKALAIRTKEQMGSFLKKENKQKKASHNVQCPKCGYEFSIDFKERFEREYLLENLAVELSEASVSISSCQEKLEKKNKEYVEARNAFALLEKNISSDEDLYNKYIKIKSAQSLIQENIRRIGTLSVAKENRSASIKLLAKELREYQKHAETAENLYKHNLAQLFAELNIASEEVNAYDYSIGDNISASGAYKDRVILAKYYAFLITKLKLASQIVNFPVVIDSPRGDEQDKENEKIIMDFILRDKIIENQVIVATIDGGEFVSEDMTVNIINLQNEKHALLNSSVYKQYERDILYSLTNLSE